MFKTLFRAVNLGLLLSGWGLAALSLHVVRTPDKIGLIPKERLGVTDTYVDARKWTMSDLPAHADLVQRVLEANKSELFRYLADPARGDVAQQLSNAIQQSAPAQRASATGGPLDGLFKSATRSAGAGFDSIPLPVDF